MKMTKRMFGDFLELAQFFARSPEMKDAMAEMRKVSEASQEFVVLMPDSEMMPPAVNQEMFRDCKNVGYGADESVADSDDDEQQYYDEVVAGK